MQITASKAETAIADRSSIFAKSSPGGLPLCALNRALTEVTTTYLKTHFGQAERLSPDTAGTVKDAGRVRNATLLFKNGTQHHCLALNRSLPVLKDQVVIIGEFVICG